jgi:hypothetical protein
MSFDDDNRDDPVLFTRDAMCIVVTCTDGSHIQTIDLPALQMRRSEVDPTWLELHDAEQKERTDGA